MLFDKETRYWQKEYKAGNLDDVDMPGEIRALLDGSAEKIFWFVAKMLCITIVCLVCILYVCY